LRIEQAPLSSAFYSRITCCAFKKTAIPSQAMMVTAYNQEKISSREQKCRGDILFYHSVLTFEFITPAESDEH